MVGRTFMAPRNSIPSLLPFGSEEEEEEEEEEACGGEAFGAECWRSSLLAAAANP
jgi:hypothetical protein